MNVPEYISTEKKSLLFPDEKQQAKFELGVSCAIFLWDDLKTAVDQNWGGPESAEKREWTVTAVIDLFDSKEVAIEDIEYRLLGIMEDEFDVNLETGTAADVAEQVMGCYAACAHEQYQYIDAIYQKFQGKSNARIEITVEGDDEKNEDEDGDESMDDEEPELVQQQKKGPIIDDDGFELVQRRR